MWVAVLFISAGILMRLMPHLPNFTPLAAMALFCGVYCRKSYGWFIVLAMYIISDLIIGLHNTIIFTWGSLLLIYFLGLKLASKKSAGMVVFSTLSASIVFFLITNFGVWLMGWYPHTVDGLVQCFVNALPFFRTSVFANLAYGLVLFAVCELYSARQKLAKKAA